MRVKMILNATNLSKEDLRAFIQALREWQLRTPASEVVGVLFDTDPQLSTEDAKALFQGIYPPFNEPIEVFPRATSQLNLGTRAIAVGGKIIGTCDELSLTIAEATEEEIQALQDAQTINLVKIQRG